MKNVIFLKFVTYFLLKSQNIYFLCVFIFQIKKVFYIFFDAMQKKTYALLPGRSLTKNHHVYIYCILRGTLNRKRAFSKLDDIDITPTFITGCHYRNYCTPEERKVDHTYININWVDRV